ncbi:MAG TPA: hypothetical protein VK066_06465 [Chloroflexota bacterium]|nr:hypothetical protein [Chloroflexota bacterium]
MLAARDIELARETARDLRAQGKPERAQAVEAVLAAALAAQSPPESSAAPEYVTFPQAARALGTEVKAVRQWIIQGRLPTVEIGGEPAINLHTILDYLDRLREDQRPSRPKTPPAVAGERRRYQAMLRALPKDKLARLEALHERMEDGESLSRAERGEMIRLERELTDAAGRHLEERTARSRSRGS